MNSNDRKIKEQLTRYITGECTRDEYLAISGLIRSDESCNKLYQQLLKAWELSKRPSGQLVFDVDKAWSSLEGRMDSTTVKYLPLKTAQNRMRTFAGYALKVAAVLVIGLVIFQLVISRNPLKTFDSGEQSPTLFSLADGSQVFLNSASTLKYPQKFAVNNREVYFWGEAFFEITPDPEKPFIIESGETRIKVLGTSFNLKAYPGSELVEVVVNSGKVLFYHVDADDNILGEVILEKGEKGVFNKKSRQIAKSFNNEPNYLSWKTGILIFNETTLDKVLAEVGKKYGVTFAIPDKDLCQLKLTATFDNESLDSVIEVLKLVHNLQIVNDGKDYLVTKKAG